MRKLLYAVMIATLSVVMASCENGTEEGNYSLTTNIAGNTVTLSGAQAGEYEITITSNMNWTAKSETEWLVFSAETGTGNGSTTAVYEANPGKQSRSGAVQIIGKDNNGNTKITIPYIFSQPGTDSPNPGNYLNVLPGTVNFIPYQGVTEGALAITSNVSWTVTRTAEWITPQQTEGAGDATFRYAVEPNDGDERTGTLTFTCTDESLNVAPVTVTMTQNAVGTNPEYYLQVVPVAIDDIPYAGLQNNVLTVSANVDWVVTKSSNWITTDISGGQDDGVVKYSVSANSGEARSAKITFTCTDEDKGVSPVEVTLSQLEYEQPVDPIYGWNEIPEFPSSSTTDFVTHFVNISSKEMRNFSLLWDRDEKIAYWVAFPMHPSYDGSAGRNEKWTYDPKILTQYQPKLNSSYAGNYSRGHQCASGDRQVSYAANIQTFYYSNMTPQEQNFNGGIWAKLEGFVQDRWICTDTLYVVTGAALLDSPVKYTADKSGTSVAIPSHYYKVLARSKAGNTGKSLSELSADQIKCVGFWYEHEPAGGWNTKANPSSADMKSVADIEELTGYTFFPALPSSIKQSYTAGEWGM